MQAQPPGWATNFLLPSEFCFSVHTQSLFTKGPLPYPPYLTSLGTSATDLHQCRHLPSTNHCQVLTWQLDSQRVHSQGVTYTALQFQDKCWHSYSHRDTVRKSSSWSLPTFLWKLRSKTYKALQRIWKSGMLSHPTMPT